MGARSPRSWSGAPGAAEGGFSIDWPGGPAWETVVADELPTHLTAAHGADPDRGGP